MPLLATFAGASARGLGFQAGVGDLGAYEQIASTTLTGSVADVTFTSIPQNYTHLQLRSLSRRTGADTDNNVYIQFNSDTGTNYSNHGFYGTGATTASFGGADTPNPIAFRNTGGSSAANMFGLGVLDILDYSNTNKYKTCRSISGHDQNGSGLVFFVSNNWRSTSAITSIKLYAIGTDLVQYSSFALYGIKG